MHLSVSLKFAEEKVHFSPTEEEAEEEQENVKENCL